MHEHKKFQATVSVTEPEKKKKQFSKALKQESATKNLLPATQRELIQLARAASQSVFGDAMKWEKYSGFSHVGFQNSGNRLNSCADAIAP